MADWTIPMSYNYSPSYHAYAYGLMYPQGPDQTHPNMTWTEAYGSTSGVTGRYYSSQTQSSQTPPGSPEYNTTTCGHFQNSVMYYADSQTHTQNGRLFFSHNRVQHEQRNKEQDRTGSDSPSDSETHTPDSWSSGISRESNAAQVDHDIPDWVKKDQVYETDGRSPGGREPVTSSHVVPSQNPSGIKVEGECGPQSSPTAVPSSPGRVMAPQPRKAKARTSFSEGQMSALNDRFNVQRYLTPAEMKTLAGLTGLTYKQVKTWFQNRRMKLKRHQKDNSWVSERYISTGIPNPPTQHSQFQGDALLLNQDFYPQFRDAVFKKSPPQTPSFYPNYTRPLTPVHGSPRQGNWPLPPAVMPYDFPNPPNFLPASVNAASSNGVGASESDNSPTQMTTVHNTSQWSS
ncbi:homeobox protein NANOG [Trichomycterus rosablanca]|uniref:homeobox protein NANOG n=1 Tax=Trichomycterus rosablanca TaxID=2290929 RepID=UPI002F35407B